MSNLLSVGANLDTLFAARLGTKRADVFIKSSGLDISNRYEARQSLPRAATGWKSQGVDLAELFQDIGVSIITVAPMTCVSTMSVSASATFSLRATGDIYGTNGNNTAVDRGDWLSPKTGMSGYSCRWSFNSGDAMSGSPGSAGTWIQLGVADRQWTLTQTVAGSSKTGAFNLSMRNDASGVVLASVVIALTASRTG